MKCTIIKIMVCATERTDCHKQLFLAQGVVSCKNFFSQLIMFFTNELSQRYECGTSDLSQQVDDNELPEFNPFHQASHSPLLASRYLCSELLSCHSLWSSFGQGPWSRLPWVNPEPSGSQPQGSIEHPIVHCLQLGKRSKGIWA
jgi:hypothetical protein